MKFKMSVLGHFGKGENLLNGQTVKTKIITEELENYFGQGKILKIDTCGGWRTVFKAPYQVFQALKNSINVLIFPAQNGLRIYTPLLLLTRKLFKNRKIHYIVIGGWLPQFLLSRKNLAKMIKKFDGIYVETNMMKTILEEQGFNNVFVMPNCKKLKILSKDSLVYSQNIPYKLCTFSRVMKEKGIEDAINAVIAVNKILEKRVFSLDIYGQVDEKQIEWFELLQKKFPKYIKYRGVVHFDKSVDILKNYFALLFPTYYEGEGFAGTLIDAYSAGVPVIASNWKYNSEIINKNVGYIYHTGNQLEFVEILKTVAINPKLLFSKKIFCLKEAEKYNLNKVVQKLIERIERD